jgi:hypothetical protein
MKPTPQISPAGSASFPFTDYNYQSAFHASHAGTKETRAAHRKPGFWKLGTEFHAAEAVYGDAADFFVFTLIGLCCTWLVFSVGVAIRHVFLG